MNPEDYFGWSGAAEYTKDDLHGSEFGLKETVDKDRVMNLEETKKNLSLSGNLSKNDKNSSADFNEKRNDTGASSSGQLPNLSKMGRRKAKREMRKEANKMRPHKCKTCGRHFQSSSQMLKHSIVHTMPLPHKCTRCYKAFPEALDLQTHMDSAHPLPLEQFTCDTCGYVCPKEAILDKHKLNKHTGIRPYKCEPCGRSFKSESDLTQHNSSLMHKS